MKKTKILNWTILTPLMVFLAIFLIASFFSIPSTSLSGASTYAFSDDLQITVRNSNYESLSPSDQTTTTLKFNNTEEENYSVLTYYWKDVKSFAVNFNLSSLQDRDRYSYSYSVSWTPAIINNGSADFTTEATLPRTLISQTAQNKSEIIDSFTFTIDNNFSDVANNYSASSVFAQSQETGSSSYDLHGGWGMYIFSFECENSYTSAIYQILPTPIDSIKAEPTINVSEQSSQEGMKSAYMFSLSEECQYLNRDYIVWKIEGTGRDGLEYVLTTNDITDSSTQHALINDEPYRNGPSFFFDTEKEGTWTAVCYIYDQDPTTSGAQPIYEIRSAQVTTSQGMSPNTIIWIVVGIAAAAAIIVGIVVGVSIKKERVY